MKYKLIPSLAHNLSHSFMSAMNYVGDNYVCEHVYALARAKPGKVITVHWIPPRTNELFSLPSPVRKSIVAYRKWLPKLIKSHKLKLEMFRELRTEVYLAKNFRIYVRAVAVDDRGKEHVRFVVTG